MLSVSPRCECALGYGVTHPLYMCIHEWFQPKYVQRYVESIAKEAESRLSHAPKKETPSRPDWSPSCLLTKYIVRRDTFSKDVCELLATHVDGSEYFIGMF